MAVQLSAKLQRIRLMRKFLKKHTTCPDDYIVVINLLQWNSIGCSTDISSSQ